MLVFVMLFLFDVVFEVFFGKLGVCVGSGVLCEFVYLFDSMFVVDLLDVLIVKLVC